MQSRATGLPPGMWHPQQHASTMGQAYSDYIHDMPVSDKDKDLEIEMQRALRAAQAETRRLGEKLWRRTRHLFSGGTWLRPIDIVDEETAILLERRRAEEAKVMYKYFDQALKAEHEPTVDRLQLEIKSQSYDLPRVTLSLMPSAEELIAMNIARRPFNIGKRFATHSRGVKGKMAEVMNVSDGGELTFLVVDASGHAATVHARKWHTSVGRTDGQARAPLPQSMPRWGSTQAT
eukprot:1087620-Prymnesium_polylepis.2